MQKALNLDTASYQWLLTIFYISYIVFEWFALMWKVVPPHMWAAFCVTGWGIAATCQAAAVSYWSFTGLEQMLIDLVLVERHDGFQILPRLL